MTSLIGRSSVGRLGLFLQITADLGHLGKAHCWTLELKVVQSLIVYPHMKIGQVSFWQVTGGNNKCRSLEKLIEKKQSTYTSCNIPMIYKQFHELNKEKNDTHR